MSDWLTIRVELLGRLGEELFPAPGRVLLVHPEHSLSEFAEAVDSAFGRWDVTPLHEFTVEGRRLLPGGDPDDGDAGDSEEVTFADLAVDAGTEFSYVFDLGEGWEHDCRVEEVGVDAEAARDADLPVPVFGWGTIPDQYGRISDDEEDDDDPEASDDEDFADAADDDEIDFGLVARAVPDWRTTVPAEALDAAAARLHTESELGLPPFDVLLAAAGLGRENLPADDEALWTAVAAAAIQPVAPTTGDPAAEGVWGTLEAADWAGLIIGLVRGDIGQSAEPEVLAHLIATCPDVETEPLFGEDRDAVLEALETVGVWWQALGAIDDDRRLTPLGRWGIPQALNRAWA